MLKNRNAGAPVIWSIGPAGGATDDWPARLAETPQFGVDDRGRQGLVATIITLQKALDGSEFMGERIVQVRYLVDRTHRVPELDGTKDEPKALDALIDERVARLKEFRATRTAATSAESLLAGLVD